MVRYFPPTARHHRQIVMENIEPPILSEQQSTLAQLKQ